MYRFNAWVMRSYRKYPEAVLFTVPSSDGRVNPWWWRAYIRYLITQALNYL